MIHFIFILFRGKKGFAKFWPSIDYFMQKTKNKTTKTTKLPSNNGHIFLQQVIPPSLVYWPRDVSKKKTGIPQANSKMRYGIKKAPGNTCSINMRKTDLSCICACELHSSAWQLAWSLRKGLTRRSLEMNRNGESVCHISSPNKATPVWLRLYLCPKEDVFF